MQINPVTAAERLVAQTATDAATQAARVATFPIPRAVLLNLSRAVGGGGMTKASTGLSVFGTPAAVGTAAAAFARGVGVVGTVESIVQDGVVTATRLVPASIEAATGIIISTINVPLQTGLATARVFLNVGTAVLTLNPATVLNTAALGAVRIAGVVEQTAIGTPALKFNSAQSGTTVAVSRLRRTPSILTSILNGRDEIANAIYPVAARAQSQAVSGAAQTTAALTTAAAAWQKGTPTPVAKSVANRTGKVNSTAKATQTGPKHAKK